MSVFCSQSPDIEVNALVTMLSTQMQLRAQTEQLAQVTVRVSVPDSEHVAQIVGKCGQKIKSLRSMTNTCIKTPLQNDESVFTITGHPENVLKASEAILKASQHFTDLMKSRSNVCAIGEVTILVPVPQKYVGVVVGRNGSVVNQIKKQTNTRINTPKGDALCGAFEVTGSKVNVLAAKEAIEDKVRQAHALRNSSIFDPNLNQRDFFKTIQTPSALQMNPSFNHPIRPATPIPALPMPPSIFDPNSFFM